MWLMMMMMMMTCVSFLLFDICLMWSSFSSPFLHSIYLSLSLSLPFIHSLVNIHHFTFSLYFIFVVDSFIFLDPLEKLSKYAPKQWRTQNNVSHSSILLFFHSFTWMQFELIEMYHHLLYQWFITTNKTIP